MPEASRSIVIKRAPSDVFAFLTDPANDKRWRSGVLEMEKVSGDGVGTRVHQVVAGPGGRKVVADIEYTEWEPGRKLAFRTTTGPVRPVGSYELHADGEGTTLTFSLAAEIGGLKKLFMGGMVQKSMNAEMGGLDELKTILESGSAAT